MKLDKFRKARMLAKKVEFRGKIGSSLYFYVKSKKVHEVIYRIPTGKWLCDCQYFSLRGKECSHILACKFWLIRKKYRKIYKF